MVEEVIKLVVDVESIGERLDKFVAEKSDLSRSRVQQLIDEEKIAVNNATVTKYSMKLKEHQKVVVHVPEPVEYTVEPQALCLDIAFEDNDIVVVNKPANMVVHPAPGHYQGTLVNALLHHCNDLSGINGVMRPGIVHRLDKDTSGLIIVAKNDFAHASLSAQLKQRIVSRRYLALVHGHLAQKSGVINTLIGRSKHNRMKMAVLKHRGKKAITHYEVLEEYEKYSLVALRLQTGRTHQIRVHLAFLGHPVAGDPLYGYERDKSFFTDGQWLHAAKLNFMHPRSHQEIALKSLPSAERLRIVSELRLKIGIDSSNDSLLNFSM